LILNIKKICQIVDTKQMNSGKNALQKQT